jgi:Flp pilus assembly pilin Flp
MKLLRALYRDERGQDLVEYTLLLAFVVLSSAALFLNNGAAISSIWGVTNNNLDYAERLVSH